MGRRRSTRKGRGKRVTNDYHDTSPVRADQESTLALLSSFSTDPTPSLHADNGDLRLDKESTRGCAESKQNEDSLGSKYGERHSGRDVAVRKHSSEVREKRSKGPNGSAAEELTEEEEADDEEKNLSFEEMFGVRRGGFIQCPVSSDSDVIEILPEAQMNASDGEECDMQRVSVAKFAASSDSDEIEILPEATPNASDEEDVGLRRVRVPKSAEKPDSDEIEILPETIPLRLQIRSPRNKNGRIREWESSCQASASPRKRRGSSLFDENDNSESGGRSTRLPSRDWRGSWRKPRSDLLSDDDLGWLPPLRRAAPIKRLPIRDLRRKRQVAHLDTSSVDDYLSRKRRIARLDMDTSNDDDREVLSIPRKAASIKQPSRSLSQRRRKASPHTGPHKLTTKLPGGDSSTCKVVYAAEPHTPPKRLPSRNLSRTNSDEVQKPLHERIIEVDVSNGPTDQTEKKVVLSRDAALETDFPLPGDDLMHGAKKRTEAITLMVRAYSEYVEAKRFDGADGHFVFQAARENFEKVKREYENAYG